MDKNNLRPDYQSSYRKGFSTETALVKLANDILMNMDRQAITAVCAIDLSEAFDTVDHETLLSVLNRTFAIDGNALQWFDSYLRPRSFQVTINGTLSESKNCLLYTSPSPRDS